MGDDLQIGMTVEQPGKHQPRHRNRAVIGPAETPPDLVARLFLGRIIRRRAAHRMQPDRQPAPGDLVEHRRESRMIERDPAHVRADLETNRAHRVGPLDFGQRRIDIVQRQARRRKRGNGRDAAPPVLRARHSSAASSRPRRRRQRDPRSAASTASAPADSRESHPSAGSDDRDRTAISARAIAAADPPPRPSIAAGRNRLAGIYGSRRRSNQARRRYSGSG